MPGVQWRGQGVLRFWSVPVYEARLWVSPGFAAHDYAALPLALELTYQRALTAQAIALRPQAAGSGGAVWPDRAACGCDPYRPHPRF